MNELIMKLLTYLIVLAAIFAAVPLYGTPVDLSWAWQKAKEYDARLGAAQADNLIYQEEIGKARAQLRPSVRMNATRGRSETQSTTPSYVGPVKKDQLYSTVNYGVSVRQPLLNLSNVAAYKQAKTVAAKSDIDLQKEESALMVRITEAYCNALYAEDNLNFSQALVKSSSTVPARCSISPRVN